VRAITVLVADDEAMLRNALVDALTQHPQVSVVAVVDDAATAVQRAGELRPDVAIVDVRMPGGGVAAAHGIRVRSPQTHVIAHSSHDDTATRSAMLAAGADEYVVKGSGVRGILHSVLRGAAGHVA
jgi:DNA-binding NarL/FixJ family response regulator